MADTTVGTLFGNVIKDSLLGYIKIVYISENEGTEKMANNLTSYEAYKLMSKVALAYFKIGEYWTVIVAA